MTVSRHLSKRHAALRPLEDMEVALVRASLDAPSWLSAEEEAKLRYALSLARVCEVRTSDGRDVDLTDLTQPLRERLTDTLGPLLLDRRGVVERPELTALLPVIWELAKEHRDRIRETTATMLPWEEVEAEIREKRLVLVCGGGGGTGYVFLGAFHALEDRGIVPALLSGTSIGAILAGFRARRRHFEAAEVVEVVKDLSWPKLFRPLSVQSRFGLPAPLRLYLREGIGRHFLLDGATPMTMADLEIPLLITIAGIRAGEVPHDPEWYERRFEPGIASRLGISATRKMVTSLVRTLTDFVMRPGILKALVIGADARTDRFQVLDAMGFSSAVPGMLHYDILREDPEMEALLEAMLEQEEIARLIDGGLVDNVPARAAWRAVQSGLVGRRNALIVALDAFAPKLTSPLWIPIQRMAQTNVRRNLRYAHIVQTFTRTLSPLDLVPDIDHILRALRSGREEFGYELPLIARLLSPLPALSEDSP
ncbi:MAG: patatin-like phospholipase family protein [Deltaproteobacteria bacterium]|nr:MAG: patatin-like phospholipase family protein [Deltaproteobacteria bacterium]